MLNFGFTLKICAILLLQCLNVNRQLTEENNYKNIYRVALGKNVLLRDSIFVLSLCHLTDKTMHYLSSTDCLQWSFVGGPFQDKGWFFHVDSDVIPEPEEPFADLYGAMRWASARGCTHILFYDIGDVCAELPVFREPEYEEMDGAFYSVSYRPWPPSSDISQLLAQHIASSPELYQIGAKAIRPLATSLMALLHKLALSIEQEVPGIVRTRADLLAEIQAHALALKLLSQALKTGDVTGPEVS